MLKSLFEATRRSPLELLVLFASPAFLFAGPTSPAGIRQMIQAADTIVVAMIVEAAVAHDRTIATLKIERTLKGAARPGATLSVLRLSQSARVPSSHVGSATLTSLRGLFFLKQRADSSWDMVPAMSGTVEFERAFYVLPSGKKPGVFEAPKDSSPDLAAFYELAWSTTESHAPTIGAVFDLESLFKNETADRYQNAWRRFSSGPPSSLQILARAGMLRRSDLTTLKSLDADQKNLGALPSDTKLLDNLRFHFPTQSSEGIAILDRMISPSNRLSVRVAAATALTRSRTAASLTSLSRLLADPDVKLRALAVGGLSVFANDTDPSTHQPRNSDWQFRSEETLRMSTTDERLLVEMASPHLEFWRTWWLQNRAKIRATK